MRMLGEQMLRGAKTSPGDWVDGDWVDGAETEFSFRGAIQPLSDREAQQLPEAWRTRARWKVYSRTQLDTVSVDNETSGDRVIWQGKRLLVVATRDYMATPRRMRLRHYKYALIEPEVAPE